METGLGLGNIDLATAGEHTLQDDFLSGLAIVHKWAARWEDAMNAQKRGDLEALVIFMNAVLVIAVAVAVFIATVVLSKLIG